MGLAGLAHLEVGQVLFGVAYVGDGLRDQHGHVAVRVIGDAVAV